jgi:amidase
VSALMAAMQAIDSTVRTGWCEEGAIPAAVIDSGEVISVESTSFTEGYTFETMADLRLDGPLAPLTAPIVVRGAAPGDTLRVDILDLAFMRDFGCMLLSPGKGAFPHLTDTRIARPVRVDDTTVTFSDEVRIPTRKMLGKVSVAPANGRVLSNTPGLHGGNMDNRDIGVGASVYLPVQVPGAHLGLGDGHAVQGDGECAISAVEVELRSVVRATICKDLDIRAPLVRSGGVVMAMGAAESLDEAAQQAMDELHRLLRDRVGMDARDAAMLMSLVCDVHVAQLVNPLKSVKARVPDRFLPLP